MTDYETIKGLLRGIAAGFRAKGNVHASKTCDDAADAIEELLARDVVPTDFHERCLQLEIRKRIELEKQMPHWISVEERLPPAYESVITANKNGDVQWNYLINPKHATWSHGYHITHWMPLPDPPTEEDPE